MVRDVQDDRGEPTPDDRGQLILVGAVVLAIAIIGVVVVLNTVLFTENVTNRAALESTGDAGEFREVVESDVGPLAARTNRNATYATPEDARDAVNESVARYGSLVGLSLAQRRPAGVEVRVVEKPSVSLVVGDRDESRSFTDRNGAESWTVVDGATVRDYWLTLDADSLATNDRDAFRVNVTSGSDHWTLLVRESNSGNAVYVNRTGTAVTGSNCTVSPSPAGRVTVDFTGGTAAAGTAAAGTAPIDGADGSCSFAFAEGLSAPDEVTYQNATNATGTFRLVADEQAATVPGAVETSAPWNSPYRSYAVDAVTVNATYATTELDYRTTTNVSISNP